MRAFLQTLVITRQPQYFPVLLSKASLHGTSAVSVCRWHQCEAITFIILLLLILLTITNFHAQLQRSKTRAPSQRLQQAAVVIDTWRLIKSELNLLKGRQAGDKARASRSSRITSWRDEEDICCVARQPAPGCARRQHRGPALPVWRAIAGNNSKDTMDRPLQQQAQLSRVSKQRTQSRALPGPAWQHTTV